MNMNSKLVYVYAVLCLSVFVLVQVCLSEDHHLFSNSWAVEIKGGSHVADQLAEKHGFINRGQVGERNFIRTNRVYVCFVYYTYRWEVLKTSIILFTLTLLAESEGASRHCIQSIMTWLLRNRYCTYK